MDTKNFKIVIDSDDAGSELKKVLLEHLKVKGIAAADLDYQSRAGGAYYPEIGYNLALKIQSGEYERGILICGTGLGMSIIANKVEGVYAGVCHDVYSATRLRRSNNAQVLTMGARVIGPESAKAIVDAWIESEFDGGGSLPKIEQLRSLEKKSFSKSGE